MNTVLRCHALLCEITAFQHGLLFDLRPLYREWTTMTDRFGNIVSLPPRYLPYAIAREVAAHPPIYTSFYYLGLDTRRPDPRFLVFMAVVMGDLDNMLRWLRCMDAPPSRLLELAVRHGHLHILAHLHGRRLCEASSVAHIALLDIAAANGHVAIVDYLHRHALGTCSVEAMDAAATHGHLDVVRYLSLHRHEACTVAAFEGAACRGHVHIVQYLLLFYPIRPPRFAWDVACANGHDDVAELLRPYMSLP
ncbi:hypothetical protein SPRG_07304 [Saprolegnia parasitica CBS 223.65]|uniref:Ankyrin repeat protein n=1 Tax=Saprolegnia parasitica (strain CBS 223.65) TaxID=695850 RepID=A0A067CAC2_SAPPC|nr:hypothetical protein SPRG_07304 [Saprolegnia parasitica CBS 223.65]KDO27674.1 hypothetical protein SPRG_07304 [Saprolegnia parasitica CBS 223.65]|eukprot:XP_012201486.1 hypothetical protein SPRG_07304 [Saprolegnia parasitica CBS 223.65]